MRCRAYRYDSTVGNAMPYCTNKLASWSIERMRRLSVNEFFGEAWRHFRFVAHFIGWCATKVQLAHTGTGTGKTHR
jgi:hypothetical protein